MYLCLTAMYVVGKHIASAQASQLQQPVPSQFLATSPLCSRPQTRKFVVSN